MYAAYSGRVVRVETGLGGARGDVIVDHHPRGLGFVTKYNRISGVRVGEGDFVHRGAPFAEVSDVPDTPQALHFELWAVVDRQDGPDRAPGDGDLMPIDPSRALYAWEQQLVPDEPLVPDGQVPLSVGVRRVDTIPFLFAAFAAEVRLHVPMYEPMTDDERLVVALLREAHRRGRGLSLSLRHSPFWGLDVVTQAALA